MPIRIDAGMLTCAISDHSMEFYLDLETGEVIPGGLDEFDEDDEEYQELAAMVDNPRYLMVSPVSSDTAWRWMEEFTEAVEDSEARRSLRTAIEGRRPFRRFKDELDAFPKLRKAWFAFEQMRQLEEARDWLALVGVEAELVMDSGQESPEPGAPGRP
jgi:hypothetical protein